LTSFCLPSRRFHLLPHLNLAVFFAIPLGWATNCFPVAVPFLLALVVAAYSAELKDLMAASGRYLSPVSDDGLPLLVRHFCLPQSLRDCCGSFTFLPLAWAAAYASRPCLKLNALHLSSKLTQLCVSRLCITFHQANSVVCSCSCLITSAFGLVLFGKQLCFSCWPLTRITTWWPCFNLLKQGFSHGGLGVNPCLIDLRFGFHFFLALPASDKAIAIACFGSLTTFLLDVNLPAPNSFITLPILACALVFFMSVQYFSCDSAWSVSSAVCS